MISSLAKASTVRHTKVHLININFEDIKILAKKLAFFTFKIFKTIPEIREDIHLPLDSPKY